MIATGYCGGDPGRIAKLRIGQALIFAEAAGKRKRREQAALVRAVNWGMASDTKKLAQLLRDLEGE